ncbi:MAG: hypothetical protein ABSF26_13145 [Thermoguttaceae bacterium]|jgi:hypothetical protein
MASTTGERRWGLLFALGLLVLAGVRLYIGCPPLQYAAHDSLWLLSIGQRIVDGQLPHRDFVLFYGLAPFLPIAAGIKLVGCRGLAVTVGYMLLVPPITATAWQLGKTRFPRPLLLLIALMLAVMLMATNAPGGLSGSYAMLYNRLGWVLGCLIAIQTLVPPRERSSFARATLEGLAVGISLSCLVFTKANYLGMGVVCLVLGGVLFEHVRRCLFSAALGFAGTSLAFLAILHFDGMAYWRDVTPAFHVVTPESRFRELLVLTQRNLPFIALACVPLLVSAKRIIAQAVAQRRLTQEVRAAAGAVAMIGLGMVVCSMNHQDFGIPTLALAAAAMCEVLRRGDSSAAAAKPRPSGPKAASVLCFAAAVASFLPMLGMDLAAMGLALHWKVFRSGDVPTAARIHSKVLRDVVCPPRAREPLSEEQVAQAIDGQRDSVTGYQYAVLLNDGLEVLGPQIGPSDRIFTLDKVNILPLALGLHYGTSDVSWVNPQSPCPPAERVLSGITFVMVPRSSLCLQTTEVMWRVYGPAIREQFERAGQTRFWTVWRRRGWQRAG